MPVGGPACCCSPGSLDCLAGGGSPEISRASVRTSHARLPPVLEGQDSAYTHAILLGAGWGLVGRFQLVTSFRKAPRQMHAFRHTDPRGNGGEEWGSTSWLHKANREMVWSPWVCFSLRPRALCLRHSLPWGQLAQSRGCPYLSPLQGHGEQNGQPARQGAWLL